MHSWVIRLRDKRVRFFAVPLLAAVAAQLAFRPLYNQFTVAVGVVVLGVALLLERENPPILVSLLTGLFTVLLRSVFGEVKGFENNVQALVFYLMFGLLAQALDLQQFSKRPLLAGAILAMIDCVSNLSESYILGDLSMPVVRSILLTGCIRSVFAIVLIQLYHYQKLYIMESEHQHRYDRLNLLIADIRAETFYLQKSCEEINGVMKKSYCLYEANRHKPEVSGPALEISRAIHEVGKDYHRVLSGLQSLIAGVEQQSMTLADAFHIIHENTLRQLEYSKRNIKIRFDVPVEAPVAQYYSLFSILNNLIVNSMDACGEGDCISVVAYRTGDNLICIVSDTGCGIESELLPYIFSAGFTTKFDGATGKGGNGIGLNHVKNTVDDLSGRIDVDSEPGRGTTFTVTLPFGALLREGDVNGAVHIND